MRKVKNSTEEFLTFFIFAIVQCKVLCYYRSKAYYCVLQGTILNLIEDREYVTANADEKENEDDSMS